MLARVDVLCLDKTGTITDGSMTVVNYVDLQRGKYDIKGLISHMNAALGETNSTAKALENYFGVDSSVIASEIIPFSSDRKYSGAVFDGETFIIGAPEFVLKSSYNIPYAASYSSLSIFSINLDMYCSILSSSPSFDSSLT